MNKTEKEGSEEIGKKEKERRRKEKGERRKK
jgi:hypothetical protein